MNLLRLKQRVFALLVGRGVIASNPIALPERLPPVCPISGTASGISRSPVLRHHLQDSDPGMAAIASSVRTGRSPISLSTVSWEKSGLTHGLGSEFASAN